jgi:hypothetical protein
VVMGIRLKINVFVTFSQHERVFLNFFHIKYCLNISFKSLYLSTVLCIRLQISKDEL